MVLSLIGDLAFAQNPFDVGSRAQLFVDRVLVRSAENVSFTLHPATKYPKNPLVKADQYRSEECKKGKRTFVRFPLFSPFAELSAPHP